MSKRKSAIFFGWKGSETSGKIPKILERDFDLHGKWEFQYGDTAEKTVILKEDPDFLFSFGPLIVRKDLLARIKIAAINFHPSPPWLPGRKGPARALVARDEIYGVTSHLMDEKVDHGPILNEILFSIRGLGEKEIYDYAFSRIPVLVEETIFSLRPNNWKPKPNGVAWSRERKETVSLMKK